METKKEFKTDYLIDYHGLDTNLKISTPRLIDYLQESAVRHSDWAGYSMDWFTRQMKGWLILNWDLKIFDYPKWNEKITVKTWPCLFKGIIAYRGFEITNNINNKIILQGFSKWVYTDLEKRRPVLPPKEMTERYGIIKPEPFKSDFKIPAYDSFTKININILKVTRRDIDTNLHVNNISYIEWVIDSIPDDIYNTMIIENIKINYKKECTKDMFISIDLYTKENEIVSIITSNNVILTEIYIKFNKNNISN